MVKITVLTAALAAGLVAACGSPAPGVAAPHASAPHGSFLGSAGPPANIKPGQTAAITAKVEI